MKDSNRNIYLWIGIIFGYLMLSQLFVISTFKSSTYLDYIEMVIWLILLAIIFIGNGFPKDNNYLKKIEVKYVIIYCFLYVIIAYILGLFTGFSYSVYSHTIKNLFNNIFPTLIILISKEIIRYIMCKKSNDKIKPVIFIALIFIIYDLTLSLNYYNLNNAEKIFMFFCLELCGVSAKNSLFTYITYNISLLPTLILSILLEIVWFIFPIVPTLGNYITSVLGILMPYYLYLKTSKIIKYNEKKDIKKKQNKIFAVPVLITIIILFILVSGIGKYQMIAIASDSMNPIYYRGDAIIYVKEKASNINKGDILVFEYDNKIITHRVVDIIKIGNKNYFQTKGDNNENADPKLISEANVWGKVKYIVKYIGYPTIKLQELFNG